MAKSSNFYQVLVSRFSWQEYKLLFCISLIYALACTTQIAFPLLFKDAKLLCSHSNISNATATCYEPEACESPAFFIDKAASPYSLSTQFELVCARKSEKRKSLSIIFLVSLFGVLLNLLTVLKPVWRKSFYSFCGMSIGASLLFSVYFSSDLLLISFFLGLASFGYILILTYSFLLINDLFENDAAKVAFGVLNICWGCFGVSFAFVAMLTNADWKILNTITGIPLILASLALNLLDEDTDSDVIVPQLADFSQDQKESNWKLMREALSSRTIRLNFAVFLVYWFAQVITYIGLPIELESVGGNLYINLAIFALLELVGSYIASELSLKYEFLPTFKRFVDLTVVLFLFFFFVPADLRALDSSLISTLFVADSFCVKLSYDTSWHLIGMYLPNLFTPRFYAQYLIVAVTISRFSLIFLPYLNYFPKVLGVHPFAIYGCLWLASRIFLRNAKVLFAEKETKLLREDLQANAAFEVKSGVISETQKVFDRENKGNLIKRNNKLQKFVEMNEVLICEPEENEEKFTEKADSRVRESAKTLRFEDVDCKEFEEFGGIQQEICEDSLELNGNSTEIRKNTENHQEIPGNNRGNSEKFKGFAEKPVENGEFPVIVRKNVELKRRKSNVDVMEIIKNENRIQQEKKNLYGEESPLLTEKKGDFIVIQEEKGIY